ncbi:PilZ domain-containing protein [Microvirga rosea]|uniref:PilZ domain-containing protein n=1 Tax=Microvirga rosea TaxID=2715425 RepID=UPI001D0A034F|nr:PilZ domain-containing protein [Microvirga rosea]MCB8822196.1 PilZ domain-containing protein [Microvirga rosea]
MATIIERRSSRRFPTHLEGRITHEDYLEPVHCVVRDLSDTGVRIALSEPSEIPLEFNLEIPDEGAIASVRLIWSTGTELGGQFI